MNAPAKTNDVSESLGPAIPANEEQRLAALRSYAILDTERETAFDEITQLASRLLKVPIAAISLIDEHRQWFKSIVGLDASETTRDVSFCGHAIHEASVLVVPDAKNDQRFAANPLVVGDPKIRFYAGAVLRDAQGLALGALCVIDNEPREISEVDQKTLQILASQVVTMITLRREISLRRESESLVRAISDTAPVLLWQSGPKGDCNYINKTARDYVGKDLLTTSYRKLLGSVHHEDRKKLLRALRETVLTKQRSELEFRLRRNDESYRWMTGTALARVDADGKFAGLLGTVVDTHEQKEITHQLIENRNFLSAIVDHLPMALFCKDSKNEFRFTLWNKHAEKIFGFKEKDIIGKRDSDIFPSIVSGKMHADDIDLVENTGRFRNETSLVSLPGLPDRSFRTVKSSVSDFTGQARYVMGISEDITENLKRERELFAETTKLDTICSNIGDVVWMIDPNTQEFGYLGKTFDRVWGQDRKKYLGSASSSILDTIHELDRERVKLAFGELSEKEHQLIFRIVLPDGSQRWIRNRAFRILDADGNVLSAVGLSTDITEARRAEVAILEQNEKFQSVVDNIPVLLAIFSKDKTLEWVNEEWTRTLGWSLNDSMNQKRLATLMPDPQQRESAREFMSNTSNIPTELEVVNAQGETLIIRWERAFLSSGKSITIGTNVTAERRQSALIALQEATIVNSAKMSSLGEMAGGVAHEINNPLAIIHGLAERLTRNLDKGNFEKEQFQQSVEKIKKTSLRIAKIVKGLKDFSRAGDQDPMQEIVLSQLFEDTLEFCRERFRHHNVDLIESAPSQLRIMGRSSQLSQIILNLLNNAFDAVVNLPEKWIRIELSEQVVNENNLSKAMVCIRIVDAGSGIPPEVVRRIMEPFYTTKEVGKGTGLGLSIARGLAESHGGQLLYSPTSTNTAFALVLPQLVQVDQLKDAA